MSIDNGYRVILQPIKSDKPDTYAGFDIVTEDENGYRTYFPVYFIDIEQGMRYRNVGPNPLNDTEMDTVVAGLNEYLNVQLASIINKSQSIRMGIPN